MRDLPSWTRRANGWRLQLSHFSNHDPNFPISPGRVNPEVEVQTSDPGKECEAGESKDCRISFKSGTLAEEIDPATGPGVGRANGAAPRITIPAAPNPSAVIDLNLKINPESGVILGNTIGFTLFIEDQRTDSFTFQSHTFTGEVGR